MFAFGHVFNRQSFLFLLDLEIKKAQRYQNYLSLLSLTFDHLNPSRGKNPSIWLKTLAKLYVRVDGKIPILFRGITKSRSLSSGVYCP